MWQNQAKSTAMVFIMLLMICNVDSSECRIHVCECYSAYNLYNNDYMIEEEEQTLTKPPEAKRAKALLMSVSFLKNEFDTPS